MHATLHHTLIDEVSTEELAKRGWRTESVTLPDGTQQHYRIPYEILGYRLLNGRYHPIPVDEDGWIESHTLNLKLNISDGTMRMADVASGSLLHTSREIESENANLKAQVQALQEELNQHKRNTSV
jgi:hypothetical protein